MFPCGAGSLYLVVIMNWATRKVLSWKLSTTLEADFCVEALKEALAKFSKPEIFNTDQGSQFTSAAWIETLQNAKVKISMDGKGRWIDNRFVERLWRSLKYECIYLRAFQTRTKARSGIGDWISYYNTERPNAALEGRTPAEAYRGLLIQVKLAA